MQILKENKDKKDAEFNERLKHSKLKNLMLELQWFDFSLLNFVIELQDPPKLWMKTRLNFLID